MKQMTLAVSLVVACWSTASGAQRAQAPTEQPAHYVFVLNGCLERGSAPTAFRLTRASAIGQAPPRPSTSAASTETGDVYELQATTSVSEQGLNSEKLQPEVGARVEMTIRPVDAVSSAPPPVSSPDSEKKQPESPPQRYSVIKMTRLADTCK